MKKTVQKISLLAFIFTLLLTASAQKAKQAKPKPDLALERLRSSITYLASDKLDGRRTGSAGALAAAGFIAGEFGKIGLQPGVSFTAQNVDSSKPRKLSRTFLQKFPAILAADRDKPETDRRAVDGYNVVGILPGTDALLKDEAIVVGAHFDHLGHGGGDSLQANSTEIHHGADDNASGVAALLELAKMFAAEKKNRRTIIFVAFGGEEEGLLGSKFYLNNPSLPLEKTVAMFNLDMVGRLKDNKLTIGGTGTASEWKTLIETKNVAAGNAPQPQIVNAASMKNAPAIQTETSANFPLFSLTLNEDGFGPSDHSSFYSKQIPVLFFFTGIHEDYHKPSDTADKINYEGLKQVASFVGTLVKAVDANQKRPTYAVAKSSNSEMGRRGFNVSLGTIPSYSEAGNDGLVIDGVREDSPAAKAGLKAGDKIVGLAGKEVRNIKDYMEILSEMKAGEKYDVAIMRGTEKLALIIIPAARR